ncbi:MAG: tetratricopeptide repeat protein [Verrucomicrobia bacterium]|nr:tetratricopeptide repeat protein [Verrucomicrobiota bacterium]
MVVLLLGLGGGGWFMTSSRGPKPPAVATSGLDPAVARLIASTTDEVRSSPRSGASWGRLGAVLFAYGFDAQADWAFAQAERFSPNEPRWFYRHALVLIEMGTQVETAISKLEAAVALCRDEPDMPRLRLAQLLLERGRLEQAGENFQSLLRLSPGHPPALLGMARVRLAQGRAAESRDDLRRCADDPHVAKSAQALLAQVHQRLGDAAAAEAAARKSASLAQDQAWPDPYLGEMPDLLVGKRALVDQAQQCIEAQRPADALQTLGKITNDYPNDPEAYYGIGLVLNQGQRSAEAEQVLREHVRLAPNSAHGHSELAAALLAQKRYAEAVEALQRVLQIEPTLGKAHFNLGFACARLGRPDEAISHLRNAVIHTPNDLDSYRLLADLLTGRERFAEAVSVLERAIQLKPAWGSAQFNLGCAYARLGLADDAISHLRAALACEPQDVDTHIMLADLLGHRGQTNEAVKLLRETLLLSPADERAKSLLQELGPGK